MALFSGHRIFLYAVSSASAVLDGPVSLCRIYVRSSVTSRSSMKTAERIQLVFGIQATLDLSYTVLEGNSVQPLTFLVYEN